MTSPFRLLFRVFKERFFENDEVSPGGGFETSLSQMLGILVSAGFFAAYLLMPAFLGLAAMKAGPAAAFRALRMFRLGFPAVSFAIIGFTTVFEWDTLFPDRRDFLILAPFPLRLREILAAKFAALGWFLGLLISALNFFPTAMVALFLLIEPRLRTAAGLNMLPAQIAATAAASLFAFFSVAALQGLLICITTPEGFRRISPWIQMLGMGAMIISLALGPVYAQLLPRAVATGQQWIWYIPPVWFSGVYDLFAGNSDPLFASLGRFGLSAVGFSAALFLLTWAIGFRRHYRRSLESEGSASPTIGTRRFSIPGPPQQQAIFAFTGRTLARSTKHRLFLATWLSLGISMALLVAISVPEGAIVVSRDDLLQAPFILGFFVLSGFRTVFQFPASLASNWVFRLVEARWSEMARVAARARVWTNGLLPLTLIVAPFEITAAGWGRGLLHVALQLLGGGLLIELLFWNFDKAPFTCSWFPGGTSLSILIVLYAYGFTGYGFNMANAELALEGRAPITLASLLAGMAVLVLLWRRQAPSSEVIFDGSEPVIQTLDLN